MRSWLETYDLATGKVTVVLETDQRIEAPNWDPSGASLLINGGGRLFRVPLDQPALVPVASGFADRCNNDHGISPDGNWIVLSCHRGRGSEIFVMPAAGGEPALVSPEPPSWWHGWSPDGTRLVYVAARRGDRVIDVYTMPVAGGAELRLTFGEGQCDGPDYSADGTRIYYNCDRPDDGAYDHRGSGPGARDPDGQDLGGHDPGARDSGRDGSGGREPGGPEDRAPGYGPGHRDAPPQTGGGHAQIWVMGADGAGQRRLFADDCVNWFPHPSPCGRHLLYLAYPPGTEGHPADLPVALCLCDPEGGNRRRVREIIGGQGTINVPCWAPDGSAFAYVRYEIGS